MPLGLSLEEAVYQAKIGKTRVDNPTAR
jgi:hypothetical protein